MNLERVGSIHERFLSARSFRNGTARSFLRLALLSLTSRESQLLRAQKMANWSSVRRNEHGSLVRGAESNAIFIICRLFAVAFVPRRALPREVAGIVDTPPPLTRRTDRRRDPFTKNLERAAESIKIFRGTV